MQPQSMMEKRGDRLRSCLILAIVASHAAARRVVVVGAGWGGLGAAQALSKEPGVEVTVVDAGARPGGLVRDGYRTPAGRPAEAGQHGFWAEYNNIFSLIDSLNLPEDPLTGYDEQGQYSPNGLEATWPVYAVQLWRNSA